MEQFSHDLTIALEETSRVRAGHCWGGRRRTRSTGNLPCAPQPTEDSSSSPADGAADPNDCQANTILSDSDDRQDFKLALRVRQPCLFGNFESDSLNENFSPTRPNTRRKRKFKRMAVEYETTPSTPGNQNPNSIFPAASNSSNVKKRVIKHTSQENFRANVLFCGKRKRSHRDRYHDYEHYRLHSSSVPRQRDLFTTKGSYLEYRNRNRSKPCERILPLNKNIVSKIEKISQDSSAMRLNNINHSTSSNSTNKTNAIVGFPFNSSCLIERNYHPQASTSEIRIPEVFKPKKELQCDAKADSIDAISIAAASNVKPAASVQKADSFESSSFGVKEFTNVFSASTLTNSTSLTLSTPSVIRPIPLRNNIKDFTIVNQHQQRKCHNHNSMSAKLNKHGRRHHFKKMQFQFDDPNGMDCAGLNDFLSSSSLSSSDSEAGQTNESDREGDDELTDWPGNEAMVNFASKNDFKRAKQPRSNSKSATTSRFGIAGGFGDDLMAQDDDTLMSADEMNTSPNPIAITTTTVLANATIGGGGGSSASTTIFPPNTLNLSVKYMPATNTVATSTVTSNTMPSNDDGQRTATMPIDIVGSSSTVSGENTFIESEMSGETSNNFLSSSSPCLEVREFRAGCRRIRDERPGFTIFTSVNEHLSRFLQDSRQSQLLLPYTDSDEHAKLMELAKLYSLTMHLDNGRAVLSKTINTTQAVKIDHSNITTKFLSDYKRRCYGTVLNDDDSESTEMAS